MGKKRDQIAIEVGSWLFFAVPFAVVTSRVQSGEFDFVVPEFPQRLLLVIDSYSFYLQKILFPLSISFDYGHSPEQTIAHDGSYFLLMAIPLVLVLGWLYSKYKSDKWFWAALAFFLVPIIPVSGIVPFVFQFISTTADRYLYVALFAVGILIARLVAEKKCQGHLVQGVVVWVALLGIRSAVQVGVWKGSSELFTHAIKENPKSWVSHNNLGVVFEGRRDWEGAAAHYDSSSKIRMNPTVLNNLGAVQLMQRDYLAALDSFSRALRMKPHDAMLINNVGTAWMALGKYDKAKTYFVGALKIDPDVGQAMENLRRLDGLKKQRSAMN